jgi:hypothetical protein
MNEAAIKLLEDRVLAAIERLNRLRQERDESQRELEALRAKLVNLREEMDLQAREEWSRKTQQMSDVLREAIAELRGERD